MPLLENDVIFAYLNRNDRNQKIAEKVFAKLGAGSMGAHLSSVSLVEMELVYKSEGLENRLLEEGFWKTSQRWQPYRTLSTSL